MDEQPGPSTSNSIEEQRGHLHDIESKDDQVHWKHTWPAAEILAQFVISNRRLFSGSVILELGAGATGLVGIAASKMGAKEVVMTDVGGQEIFDVLQSNIRSNGIESVCRVEVLDWRDELTTDHLLATLNQLDYILASDVFYDPSVFMPLTRTIRRILERFPAARCYFSYQNRDSNWHLSLADFGLHASLIRIVDSQRHTFQLGVIYKKLETKDGKMFAGIEGGGTSSKLVFVKENGEQIECEDSISTNQFLMGMEKTADHIATWVRGEAKKHDVQLPLKGLGMGLSGAEDDTINEAMVDYLKRMHGDIAEHFYLASDAVATVAANFEGAGVVLIAGTGSSCRMLLEDGSVHGVGGWGHAIGDGGSAYWITNRAMRMLFDDDDSLEEAGGNTDLLRDLLLKHFKVTNKTGLLDYLYSKFDKSNVATFTSVMAQHGSDPVIAKCFFDGGHILGRHLRAASKHMDQNLLSNVPVLLVGQVFKSWELLKPGFLSALDGCDIRKISFYLLAENCAFGAAVLAARKAGVAITHKAERRLFDTIVLEKK